MEATIVVSTIILSYASLFHNTLFYFHNNLYYYPPIYLQAMSYFNFFPQSHYLLLPSEPALRSVHHH
jgi:hypothetical protein